MSSTIVSSVLTGAFLSRMDQSLASVNENRSPITAANLTVIKGIGLLGLFALAQQNSTVNEYTQETLPLVKTVSFVGALSKTLQGEFPAACALTTVGLAALVLEKNLPVLRSEPGFDLVES